MNKTMDSIANILRASKHPFRQVDDRPTKARQHRYERRKIKEFLKISEWWDPLLGEQLLSNHSIVPTER
jgi:hypothetical protein